MQKIKFFYAGSVKSKLTKKLGDFKPEYYLLAVLIIMLIRLASTISILFRHINL